MVYFTINELCYSATAQANGINDTPSATQRNALTALVDTVLDPLRRAWGKPILVNSGYRCPALNNAVGGKASSQHLRGEAADIHVSCEEVGMKMFRFICVNTDFDQLLFEHAMNNGCCWLHVSYRSGRNRHDARPYYPAR